MEIQPGKREKKHKKSSKTENNEADAIEILEVENRRRKVVEGKQGFEKDEITDIEQEDRETVKKKNKARKVANATKSEEKKSDHENQVFGICSEDLSPDAMKKVEKKRRKSEKNKNLDNQNPETESITEMKTVKEVEKRIKNKTMGKDHKDGYTENKGRKKDRTEIGTCSEICEVNASEKVVEKKKRKREKKQSKDDGSGQHNTLTEASVDSVRTDDDLPTDKILDREKKSENVIKTFIEGEDGVFTQKVEKTKKIRKEASVDPRTDEDLPTDKILDREKKSQNVIKTFIEGEDGVFMQKVEKTKKKKKKIRKEASVDSRTDDDLPTDKILDREKKSENVIKTFIEGQDGDLTQKVEKTKKKKIRKEENEKSTVKQDILTENTVDAEGNVEKNEMKKKKKRKSKENQTQDNELENGNKGKKKKPKLVENGLDSTKTKKSNKKVRFSSHVEVFPPTDDLNAVTGNGEEDNLVRGRRFTHEEDEIVKAAVFKYIEERDLGEEGLYKVLHSRKYPELRSCWKEIASAIPYRPYIAVYFRAQILFRRSETRKWSEEEYEMVRECQKEYGNQWRALADELGRHSWHVKDAWRRIKLPNLKKGHWSQEEYQGLFNLVNDDLQRRVSEEKRSKHGMLRDNICWTAISDKLSTRNQANCCQKWYYQLTSPMVAEGMWADVDDYRLLSVLYNLDSTCVEDVDWDNLLDDRSGDLCRKRWNQMVLHIGKHGTKSFAEQVEVLTERYCPHLLEAREAWDNKPRVP